MQVVITSHPIPSNIIQFHSSFSFLNHSYPITSSHSIRQLVQQPNTQNHNHQPNRHNNQQRKPKPPQYHRRRPNATIHAPIPKVLCYLRRRDRGRMLPEHGHKHEDGGDEDEGECRLGDGTRGKGLDVDVGAARVGLGVPAREGCQEEEGYEGEDDSDDSVMRLGIMADKTRDSNRGRNG